MNEPAHAVLAPSFAPVWGKCSAAVAACQDIPNPETEATRNGTASHWVCSEVLGAFRDTGEAPECCRYIGTTAPNGVVIDEDMVEGAQVYIDAVTGTVLRASGKGYRVELYVEWRVRMPDIHPENWGTLDACVVTYAGAGAGAPQEIRIFDYKHGHRVCPVEGNLQLLDYAEGVRHALGINGAHDQHTLLVLYIVQPFCYASAGPVSRWASKLSDIRGVVNKLRAKAVEALTSPGMTSGEHCRDCRACGTCSAARTAGYNLIDVVNAPFELDDMTPAEMATEYGILRAAVRATQARLDDIEARLSHAIAQGATGTGLVLETTYGRKKWGIPPAQASALASQFGFDIRKDAVMTPAQALQAAPKSVKPMFDQILKTVTTRPTGALKLKPAADSRTAAAFKPRK